MPVSSHLFGVPNATSTLQTTVAIVGGGLAGLTCAYYLQQAGIDYCLLEAQTQVGGKLQTHQHPSGFLLDEGFQVFNTAYTEAKAILDFNALELQPFYPGAIIRYNGSFNKVGDPQRDAGMWLFGLYSPIGNFKDKWLTLQLKRKFQHASEAKILSMPEESTLSYLQRFGFSEHYINAFFKPFYGGVFLEESLSTSVRKFVLTFQAFSTGTIALPKQGMHAIAQQLLSKLNPANIHLNQALIHLSPPTYNPSNQASATSAFRCLTLQSGLQIQAKQVVLATPLSQTAQLLGQPCPVGYNGTWNFYFTCKDKPPLPVREPALVLNAEGAGVIQHLTFLTEVAPHYAPNGQTLCSVTVKPSVLAQGVPQEEALSQTKANLKQWFGPVTDRWEMLQAFQVPHAIASQSVLFGAGQEALVETLSQWQQQWQVHLAGEALDAVSINGAMRSGRMVAQAISTLK